jgi:class 3 adenylate cyclase
MTRAWADQRYAKFDQYSDEADCDLTMPVYDSLALFYTSVKDTCHLSRVQSWRTDCLDAKGVLDSAMRTGHLALALFRPRCDSIVFMSVSINLSNVYLSLEDYEQALSVCDTAIAHWNVGWNAPVTRNGLYTNRAIALAYLGRFPEAVEAFRALLRFAIEIDHEYNKIDAYTNLGTIFGIMDAQSNGMFLDSSEKYQLRALDLMRVDGPGERIMTQYLNLASLALDRGQFDKALSYTDTAQLIDPILKSLPQSITLSRSRSKILEQMGRLSEAMDHLKRYIVLKDSLLNEDKVKAIADVQEKYESEKKVRQIQDLELQNLNSELIRARTARTRNILLFSSIGILLLAGGLWSRLRFVHKSRLAISKEKEISESLLHNILPEEVANELRLKGYSEAREFEHVTILFTDFKGFTEISEHLSPAELVSEIDTCFKAFDAIVTHYGIEKIKTIGDAYMAVGGLPDPEGVSPSDVVNAGIEMQEFVIQRNEERTLMELPAFEMRVGIHTGPVVAGIVGIKKFQYDIWGDTVNTASRMESSCDVGQVNISESTYLLVREQFDCVYRGEIEVKGKGEVKMYFARKGDSIAPQTNQETDDDSPTARRA